MMLFKKVPARSKQNQHTIIDEWVGGGWWVVASKRDGAHTIVRHHEQSRFVRLHILLEPHHSREVEVIGRLIQTVHHSSSSSTIRGRVERGDMEQQNVGVGGMQQRMRGV